MEIEKEIVVSWDEFPEEFCEKYENDIFMADIEDNGVVVTLLADYIPYCPGRYDGPPENCYPAEGPEVEINATLITVYPQRAATGSGGVRLYEHLREMPSGNKKVSLEMGHSHLKPFNDKFLEVATTFAMHWIEVNESKVIGILLDHGAETVKNVIDSILSSMAEERYS